MYGFKSVHHTLNFLIFTGKISAHSSKLNLIDLLGHNLFDYYKIFPMLVPSLKILPSHLFAFHNILGIILTPI